MRIFFIFDAENDLDLPIAIVQSLETLRSGGDDSGQKGITKYSIDTTKDIPQFSNGNGRASSIYQNGKRLRLLLEGMDSGGDFVDRFSGAATIATPGIEKMVNQIKSTPFIRVDLYNNHTGVWRSDTIRLDVNHDVYSDMQFKVHNNTPIIYHNNDTIYKFK